MRPENATEDKGVHHKADIIINPIYYILRQGSEKETGRKRQFSQRRRYWSATRSVPVCQRHAASIALRAHKAQSVSTVRKNRSATHGPKILTGSHQIWLHCTKIPPCCLLPFNFTSPFAQIKHCCVHNCFPHHIHVCPPFFDPFLAH